MTRPRVNFVVLFQGRTGSSFLIDMLSRHPEVTAHGEILRGLRERRVRPSDLGALRRLYAGWAGRPDAIEEQLERVRRLYDERSATPVVGFKTKVADIWDLVAMKGILESRRARAIVMKRWNLVKLAVSLLAGVELHARTGAWNVRDEADRVGPSEFSVEEFDRALRRVVFEEAFLDAYVGYLDLPKLRLEYDDLLRDRQAWLDSVYRFLEVQPTSVESRIVKNTEDDLRKALGNFDELRSHYAGTPFEPMFDEVVT